MKVRYFLARLCATVQQSYCRETGLRRPPSSSVRRHHFLGNRQVDWHHILVTGIYPPYFQTIFLSFFFHNSNFLFFYDFFREHWTIGEKTIQTTSPLKVHVRFTPTKSCILLERASTKVVQRIVKLEIFAFANCFFFFNMGPYGVKVWNDISERTHQICFPKFIYTPGEGLYSLSS